MKELLLVALEIVLNVLKGIVIGLFLANMIFIAISISVMNIVFIPMGLSVLLSGAVVSYIAFEIFDVEQVIQLLKK